MLCKDCTRSPSQDTHPCHNCGNKHHSKKPSNTNSQPIISRILLSICIFCILLTLYTILFCPIYNMPAFKGKNDEGHTLKDITEEAAYGLEVLKDEYEEERPYLSFDEKLEAKIFFDKTGSFFNNPTLINSLKFFKWTSDYKSIFYIKDSNATARNIEKQIFYVAILFILTLICITTVSIKLIKKKKFDFIECIIPSMFCYYYSGIVTVVIFAAAYIILFYKTRKS